MDRKQKSCLQPLHLYLNQLIQHYVSPGISFSTAGSPSSSLQLTSPSKPNESSNSSIQLKIEFSQHLLKILSYLSDAQAMVKSTFEDSQKQTKEMVTIIAELQKTLSEQHEEIRRLEGVVKEREISLELLHKQLERLSSKVEVSESLLCLFFFDSKE